MFTHRGFNGAWLGPLSDVSEEMVDFCEGDVVRDEVGHEGVVPAVVLEGLIDLRLHLLVASHQAGERLLPELHGLRDVEVEVVLEFLKDPRHLRGIIGYLNLLHLNISI
jgi:hypothetical protein